MPARTADEAVRDTSEPRGRRRRRKQVRRPSRVARSPPQGRASAASSAGGSDNEDDTDGSTRRRVAKGKQPRQRGKGGKAAAAKQAGRRDGAPTTSRRSAAEQAAWTLLDERRERRIADARALLRVRMEDAGADARDDADMVDNPVDSAILDAARNVVAETPAGRNVLRLLLVEDEARGNARRIAERATARAAAAREGRVADASGDEDRKSVV